MRNSVFPFNWDSNSGLNEDAFAIGLVVLPLAFVFVAVAAEHDAEAVPLSLLIRAFIALSVPPRVNSVSVFLSVLEIAFVFIAVRVDFDPEALGLAVFKSRAP